MKQNPKVWQIIIFKAIMQGINQHTSFFFICMGHFDERKEKSRYFNINKKTYTIHFLRINS